MIRDFKRAENRGHKSHRSAVEPVPTERNRFTPNHTSPTRKRGNRFVVLSNLSPSLASLGVARFVAWGHEAVGFCCSLREPNAHVLIAERSATFCCSAQGDQATIP